MIFMIGKPAVAFTLGILLLLCVVANIRLNHFADDELERIFNLMTVGLCLIWMAGLGFDQYRMQRAHDFSIPSSKLSEVELEYREDEINRQKKKIAEEKKPEELDELIKEIEQESK